MYVVLKNASVVAVSMVPLKPNTKCPSDPLGIDFSRRKVAIGFLGSIDTLFTEIFCISFLKRNLMLL